ncbi:hypothetical protein FA95DRAFT_1583134 [Auriscalpium vulgare]|uniref:Uncharacterized protein n=1 Tax=Auriscalpium vulgare TaxID=40419 RepID=A0ACB8RQU3_9AGAM|nr:hypothetical protein FA95DRAFT_1583134 [Auriscalpium vulgare]
MPRRRYRGHRAHSFVPADVAELVELRARERTFDGAYARTALTNMGYALAVLKLFDPRFYRIGIIYAALAVLLFLVAFFRARHSQHDLADRGRDEDAVSEEEEEEGDGGAADDHPEGIASRGQEGKILGRPFVTAGWIVVAVAGIVAATEVTLLVLLVQL